MTKEEELIEACSKGNLDEVRALVEQGVDIHYWNDIAFRWASENGHLEIVKYLYDVGGVDIHVHNDLAFQWASQHGHLEVVKYLYECGANIHADDDLAFRWASKYDHTDVVIFLKRKMLKEKLLSI